PRDREGHRRLVRILHGIEADERRGGHGDQHEEGRRDGPLPPRVVGEIEPGPQEDAEASARGLLGSTQQVRDDAEWQADENHDELRDPDPDDRDRQRGDAGDEDPEPDCESEDLRGGQTHMAARDHREGAIAHREGPDDRQPGEQRILRGDRREDPLEREDDAGAGEPFKPREAKHRPANPRVAGSFQYSAEFRKRSKKLLRGMEHFPNYSKYLEDELGGPNSRLMHFIQYLIPEIEYRCGPLADKTVLDFGCGPGPSTAALAMNCRSVAGYDIDRELVDVCRMRLKEHGLESAVRLYCAPNLEDVKDRIGPVDLVLLSG